MKIPVKNLETRFRRILRVIESREKPKDPRKSEIVEFIKAYFAYAEEREELSESAEALLMGQLDDVELKFYIRRKLEHDIEVFDSFVNRCIREGQFPEAHCSDLIKYGPVFAEASLAFYLESLGLKSGLIYTYEHERMTEHEDAR